jgi:hypothetical protein
MYHRIGFLSLAALLSAATGVASAEAPAKKKVPAAAARSAPAVPKANEKAVSEILGPWKWGMTPDEVLAAMQKQLSEVRAPEMAKLTDVYAQQQMRKQIKADVDEVRRSYLKFDGQKSGWDVSIIEGEFLQKNGESMMLYRETDPGSGREQQRFFFFKDDKLWKQFVAFNMEAYKGKTFDDFRGAMEACYGKGAPIVRRWFDGKDHTVAVAWRSSGTYLRAVDLMKFYSNFCLAFSDETVERQMDVARAERSPQGPPRVVVTAGGKGGETVNDPNADVIDRITAGQAPQRVVEPTPGPDDKQ